MSGIKRWALRTDTQLGTLSQDQAGDWVHIADHDAEVARLTADLALAQATWRDLAMFAALTGICSNPFWDNDTWEVKAIAAQYAAEAALAARRET